MRTDIEFFRIIAAFGIIWFHAELEPWRQIAYGGLIYFVILASYFSMVSAREYSPFDRVQRIIFPYVFWFFCYFLLFFLADKSINPKNHTLPSFIVSSPSIHLWFLPFIFIVLCVIDFAKKITNDSYKYILCVFSALFAAMLIFTSPIWRTYSLPAPLAQYAHVTAAVFIGIFLSCSHRVPKCVVLGLIIILISSMLWMIYMNQPSMGVSYLVGFIPCIALLTKRSFFDENAIILFVANMSFGVYLMHMVWVMILRHFDVTGALLPVTSFILSLVFVWGIKRYLPVRLGKYIV